MVESEADKNFYIMADILPILHTILFGQNK